MVATVTYGLETIEANFQASSYTPGDQLAPDVLGLSNGGYVVAYNNFEVDDGFIYLDFYDATGTSIGGFLSASSGPSTAAGAPTLAQMSNGNVVVIWDDNQAADEGLRGAIFTPEGVLVATEFEVTDDLEDEVPQVTALTGENGGFVVTNQNVDSIYIEVFDEDGNSISNEISITTTHDENSEPVVTGLADGGFVVTWTHDNGTNLELRARIFEADGTPREVNGSTDDFLVATSGDNSQPAITALPNGSWAVAYTDSGWQDEDIGITLTIMGPNGEVVTPYVHVNTPSNVPDESDPDITVLDNGFIVVSWTIPANPGDNDIYCRIFDQDGNPITVGGNSQIVLDGSLGNDVKSAVSGILAGQFVAGWQANESDGDGGQITATVKELVRTTTGDGTSETLSGDELRDVMLGNGGSDILKGGLGKDTLDGGAGGDYADYRDKVTSVSVTLNGASDAIVTVGGVAEDTIKNIENIYGGTAGDILTGDWFGNYLFGNAGNDLLKGGGGADTLDGSTGVDRADYSDKVNSVVVTLNGATNATVTVGGVAEDTIRNIENLVGGSAGDILTGDGLANTLRGGGGADLLNGAAGVDRADYADKTTSVVVTLNGATNATVTVGGVAEDTVRNIENVRGGSGNDTLTGDGLANLLDGGAGTDVLKGGLGTDTLDGGANGDFADYRDKVNSVDVTLNGANDATVKVGGVAEDTVRNIENVYGGTAGDVLRGDGFANYFYGHLGNDLLSGGGGNDTLAGAAGADTYRFNTALNAATNVDHITDFATEDTIHLDDAVFTTLTTPARWRRTPSTPPPAPPRRQTWKTASSTTPRPARSITMPTGWAAWRRCSSPTSITTPPSPARISSWCEQRVGRVRREIRCNDPRQCD